VTVLFANWRKQKKNIKKQNDEVNKFSTTRDLFNTLSSSSDFLNYQEANNGVGYWVSFYRSLIDTQKLHKSVNLHLFLSRLLPFAVHLFH